MTNLNHVPKITINGHEIERVYKKEVLGIVIDNKLSCNKQNESHCNTIKKAKEFVGLETFQIMYKALVMPHLNYCSTVWQNNNQPHLDKLCKLQKKAAKIITNSDYVRS